MTQRDFYQVLGVARTASPPEIRAAFVRLAKQHHPDHASDAGELSRRVHGVQQAYRCLSDPATRAEHDRALAEADRRHFVHQRHVQRRLHRYDDRHPRPQPRVPGRLPWRTLLAVAVGAAIVARVAFMGG